MAPELFVKISPEFVKMILELVQPLSFEQRRSVLAAVELVIGDAEKEAKTPAPQRPRRHRRRNTK
jgi:hypothetical protein